MYPLIVLFHTLWKKEASVSTHRGRAHFKDKPRYMPNEVVMEPWLLATIIAVIIVTLALLILFPALGTLGYYGSCLKWFFPHIDEIQPKIEN